MTAGQVAALAQDPAFQHAFVTQTMQNFGTNNAMDPRVLSAWRNITEKANQGWQMHDDALRRQAWANGAMGRTDLSYPGAQRPDPTTAPATVNFGGKDIKVPGLPAYLVNQQGGLNVSTPYDVFAAAAFAQSVLPPGMTPGYQGLPEGLGAAKTVVSPTSGATVSVKPAATPTTKPPTTTPIAGAPLVATNPYASTPPPGVAPSTWNAHGGGGPGGSGV
jgi:hypothetical protein